jgi:hypothetical protein
MMVNGSVNKLMQQGIDQSELFVCCATTNYCASHNCKRELEYADYMNKNIIFILFEKFNGAEDRKQKLHEIGFYLANKKYYKHVDVDGIVNAVKDMVNIYRVERKN